MGALPFVSYFFDLLGRRAALVLSLLVQGGGLFALPYLTDGYELYLTRGLIAVATASVTNSPLISDYVSKQSRGKVGTLVYLG